MSDVKRYGQGSKVYVLASDYDRDTQALVEELDNIKRSWGLLLSQRDALHAQVEAMRADAERFHFVFSCPSPMIQIELEALRGEPKTIDWYRQKIDACIALQAKP